MTDEALVAKPDQIQLVGLLHLVGGFVNMVGALAWMFYGGITAISTFGLGSFLCCPVFVLFPIACLELYTGVQHLGSNHQGLKAPRVTAIAEISTIVCCSPVAPVLGIISLMLTNDPKMQAYYARMSSS